MLQEEFLAAKLGNTDAINRLMTQTYSTVRWAIQAAWRNRCREIDDVIQTAMLKVARDLATCKANDWDEYQAWVGRIARNSAANAYMRERTKKRDLRKQAEVGDTWQAECRRSSPDTIAAKREELQLVRALAGTVSRATQVVVEMLSEGHRTEEISEALGISDQAVYAVKKRFRQKIR